MKRETNVKLCAVLLIVSSIALAYQTVYEKTSPEVSSCILHKHSSWLAPFSDLRLTTCIRQLSVTICHSKRDAFVTLPSNA